MTAPETRTAAVVDQVIAVAATAWILFIINSGEVGWRDGPRAVSELVLWQFLPGALGFVLGPACLRGSRPHQVVAGLWCTGVCGWILLVSAWGIVVSGLDALNWA